MRSRIALLPGDGVGKEVVPEARRVVDALDLGVEWTVLDWGADRWERTGELMPADGPAELAAFDSALLGAVGDPRLPDHVSLWGMLLAIRQQMDLWANLRPVRLFPGVQSPLSGRGPDDIDMLFVRENSKGEYAGVGGRSHVGLPSRSPKAAVGP